MAEIQAVLPRRLGPLMRNADGIWRLDPRRPYAGRVRSAEELRARWLDLIALIMKRTGMYAATGSEMQLLALHLLKDLCFLDDKDADAEREWSRLLRTYGKRGAVGPFEALFESRRCQAEVASVFAEVFHRLGYLSVGKLVSGDRWQEMTSGLRDRFEDRDVTQDGARGLLGEPSLVIDRKVLCYVPEDPAAGWLFIDCHAEQARRYNVGRGSYYERVLGGDHPDTMAVWGTAVSWTGDAGYAAYGRNHSQVLLQRRERILGPDHPRTLAARGNLAYWTEKAAG
jgi:hypothetical protein